MPEFPQLSPDLYPSVFIEDTDQLLPRKVDQNLRYAFFKVIAKGGKCLVQSCKDLNLNRFICYKSLLPEFQDDPIEQQRFVREARVTAMLQHPNTVPTYDLGRDNKGRYYFTMKLVHGYTFREVLDYRERYDLTQMMDVIIQVAHALEYAHTHGVIHRDLKPDNILVGPFGEVLLMDWGLAKVRSRTGKAEQVSLLDEELITIEQDPTITMHGKLEGTLCYMSPEQIKRDPDIDCRTDIYSLGALIYEILTGKTPVTGYNKTADEVIAETMRGQFSLPSTLSKLPFPKRLEQITMQCLANNAAERPASASAVIRFLQECLVKP